MTYYGESGQLNWGGSSRPSAPSDHGGYERPTPQPKPKPRPKPQPPVPARRREWWWLQGEHRLPITTKQWKQYDPDVQDQLDACHEVFISSGQRVGLLMDMGQHHIRKAESVQVENSHAGELVGRRAIAGWDAQFWQPATDQ